MDQGKPDALSKPNIFLLFNSLLTLLSAVYYSRFICLICFDFMPHRNNIIIDSIGILVSGSVVDGVLAPPESVRPTCQPLPPPPQANKKDF
jgi:hypothetical protein